MQFWSRDAQNSKLKLYFGSLGMCCVVSLLDWLSMKRMKRAKHCSWWQHPHRGCSTMWMGCDGESCWSFSIVTILPSCSRGKKRCEAALAMWCWRIPAQWILIFSKSVSCCMEGFARSAVLVAAIMVKSLPDSQEVTRFHPLRSLSVGIPGCITNFNPWPPGSLRPRLCRVGMTQLSLWYRGSCVSSGASLLQCFPISLPEKSVMPAKATELLEFKWHKGFSRIQI